MKPKRVRNNVATILTIFIDSQITNLRKSLKFDQFTKRSTISTTKTDLKNIE